MEEEDKSPTPPEVEKCHVCAKISFKYKCPRCFLKSCSLACVKAHKEIKDCTGIPDKVTFVDLKTFGTKQLHKDIDYITDLIDAANRNSKKYAYHYGTLRIEGKLKQLRNICKNKRGCLLRLAPAIFAANQRNKSFYNRQEDAIYWTIGCCFVREEEEKMYYLPEAISEETKIGQILEGFLDKTKYYGADINEMLSGYSQDDFKNARVFIKSIAREIKEIIYKEIKQENALKEILKGEEISDFPMLYIVFRDVSLKKNKNFAKLADSIK